MIDLLSVLNEKSLEPPVSLKLLSGDSNTGWPTKLTPIASLSYQAFTTARSSSFAGIRRSANLTSTVAAALSRDPSPGGMSVNTFSPPMESSPLVSGRAQHDHRHGHGYDSRKRLIIVLALTAIYMFAETFGGWWTGSLALLADAGHMLADVA